MSDTVARSPIEPPCCPEPSALRVTRLEHFLSHVTVDESGCWLWTGYLCHGYGRFRAQGRTWPAHRYAYVRFVGPVPPEKRELDHLCRVRHCVNPLHVEPVTSKENHHRSPIEMGTKTHCPQGHPYEGDNLIVRHGSWGGRKPVTNRLCRACEREHHRRLVIRRSAERAVLRTIAALGAAL